MFGTIFRAQEFSALPAVSAVELEPGAAAEILLLVGILIVVFFLGFGILLVIRGILTNLYHGRHGAFEKVVLLVLLPKEAIEAEKKGTGEERLEAIREQIGSVEAFFATLAGLRAQKGFLPWLRGREDHFSFELVAQNGLLSFYVVAPRNLQQFVEEQLHAQLPDAMIEEVKDYNIFKPLGAVAGTMLGFKRASAFPIRTYRKIEADPLNGIANSLSKVSEENGAVIQYLVRSAKSDWRKFGVKIASLMQQGKKLSEAMRAATWWGDFTSKLPVGKSKKKEGEAPPKEYKLTPLEEEMVKSLEEKSSKLGLDLCVRIITSAKTDVEAGRMLDSIVGAYAQFNAPQYGNILVKRTLKKPRLVHDFIFRNFDEKRAVVVNTEEFASLFHFPLPTTETPNIRWLSARKAPAPTNVPKEGTVLGFNIYRGVRTEIRMRSEDRMRHMYIIGRSGSGKSVLMENMAIQDIRDGYGVGVVDPHGELVEHILAQIPKERAEDVVLFDPSDYERPVGLNMLEFEAEEQKDMAVQEMIAIFYKLFPPEMIGPMFEHHMRNVMLTLMNDPNDCGTIVEIPRMFSDPDYQKAWVSKLRDPVVRAYWEKEVAKTSDFHKSEMLGYLISKVGRFVENAAMRNIVGQQRSSFNFKKIMDEGKILLINLSKGKTGDVNAKLLGLIIVSKLQMAALARADVPESERKDFFLFIDEFQNFITESISTILSEARKYRLSLTMAHQYMGQLVEKQDTAIRDAILGNAGTFAVFRIGVEDAEILEKEFKPIFNAYDLVNVEKFTAYVKLLIENTASKPFNMMTYPPKKGDAKLAAAMKQLSRLKYARPREIVEREIMERSQLGAAESAPPEALGERLGF